VGDAGVECGEGHPIARGTEPEREVEGGFHDAGVAHGDDGLVGVAIEQGDQGGAGADEERRPAFATGRKGAKRVRAGRRRIDTAVSVTPLVHRHSVGVPGSKLVEFLRGLHRKPQRPRHIAGGLPGPG